MFVVPIRLAQALGQQQRSLPTLTPISIGRPELMVSSGNLQQALEWASSVVIGPGLGQNKWAQHTFIEVIYYCQTNSIPLVIDADALN